MVLTRFRPILQKFVDRGADFIVVGGVAALIHAAPILTFDLDLVPESRTTSNEWSTRYMISTPATACRQRGICVQMSLTSRLPATTCS